MKYYIYIYIRKDTGDIFYVGKGQGNRYRSSNKYKHNPLLKNICKKTEFLTKFIYRSNDENDIFIMEKFLINFYGRRDLRLGTLCNLTDGGEGSNTYVPKGSDHYMYGKKVSEEVKLKIKQSTSGTNNKNWGKKFSRETRNKISNKLKGRISPMNGKVLSNQTKEKISTNSYYNTPIMINNKFYPSLPMAARELKMNIRTLYSKLRCMKKKGVFPEGWGLLNKNDAQLYKNLTDNLIN